MKPLRGTILIALAMALPLRAQSAEPTVKSDRELDAEYSGYFRSRCAGADAIVFTGYSRSGEVNHGLVTDPARVKAILDALEVKFPAGTATAKVRLGVILSIPELFLTFFQNGKELCTLEFREEYLRCELRGRPEDVPIIPSGLRLIHRCAKDLMPNWNPPELTNQLPEATPEQRPAVRQSSASGAPQR